jgi:hypothetical protein
MESWLGIVFTVFAGAVLQIRDLMIFSGVEPGW